MAGCKRDSFERSDGVFGALVCIKWLKSVGKQ